MTLNNLGILNGTTLMTLESGPVDGRLYHSRMDRVATPEKMFHLYAS